MCRCNKNSRRTVNNVHIAAMLRENAYSVKMNSAIRKKLLSIAYSDIHIYDIRHNTE